MLETIEKAQNSLTYATGIWLATQKVIRRDFEPAERTELEMLVLKAWRRDPGQASVDLAELIAELPEGVRATLVQAAAKAFAAAGSATSCSTARSWSRTRWHSSPTRWSTPPALASRMTRRTTRTGCSPG
jgi:hypothetical protein